MITRLKHFIAAVAGAMALAAVACTLTPFSSAEAPTEMRMPTTAAEHTAEAAKYDREAVELEAQAERHAKMAAHYRARISEGSKQAATLTIFANHYQGLAEQYRQAARKARAMAQSHTP